MQIGIDIRPLNWMPYGGVSEYIRNLLPAIFAQAPQHTFKLFVNARKINFESFENLLDYNNVELFAYRYPSKLFNFSCRYLNSPLADELIGGSDVFFSPHFLPVPLTSKCSRVTTFADISFEFFPSYFNSRMRLWHKYVAPRIQAELSDKIIAVSNSTKEDIVSRYNIEKSKIKVIHHGIGPNLLRGQDLSWEPIKRKYLIPDNYILTLSTIEPRKNIVALIRAFNVLSEKYNIKDYKLVIAGTWGWSYKKIIKEAQESKFSQDIIFTGPVKEEHKYQIYKNAKIFVYPSLYEGFGLPPIEAMRAGTPTLVSFISSLPEATGGNALLINPYNPTEIASNIFEVISDSNLSSFLSQKGIEYTKNMTWEKCAQETLNLLENSTISLK